MRKGSGKAKNMGSSRGGFPTQTGKFFSVHASGTGKSAVTYFSTMAKTAKLLMDIDTYLYGQFPDFKSPIIHSRFPTGDDDILVIHESTGQDDRCEEILQAYLRKGKEYILASLQALQGPSTLDELQLRLTELVNDVDRKYVDNKIYDKTSHRFLHKIELAQLLDTIWRFFENLPNSFHLKLMSVESTPTVQFKALPDLMSWVEHEDDPNKYPGLFILTKTDLEHPENWRGRLKDSGIKGAVHIVIEAEKYLSGLRSAKENETNGILIGDVIKASYKIKVDPIQGKTTYHIVEVHDIFRADVIELQYSFQYDIQAS